MFADQRPWDITLLFSSVCLFNFFFFVFPLTGVKAPQGKEFVLPSAFPPVSRLPEIYLVLNKYEQMKKVIHDFQSYLFNRIIVSL
jgi:hypothetical protein